MTAVDFAAFVDRLATVSGDAIRPFFRTSLGIENKGGSGAFDPVTAADRAAESAMRALIRESFPDHGIIGEEFGNERIDAEYCWVLDPIDGTKSFIAGMPAWGTLIALMRGGEPVYGMMHQPFIRERFTGDSNAARYRGPAGERALHVRRCAQLNDAMLMTTSPLLMKAADRAAFGKVEQAVKLSRYGGDCYAYCMLAAGHVDLVIETELKPYDILPLIPIITGAGGIVTAWDGGAPTAGGRIIAAGDPRVHEAAMKMLGG
jgi:myo-inositol-1(or 4)-monophosphatase